MLKKMTFAVLFGSVSALPVCAEDSTMTQPSVTTAPGGPARTTTSAKPTTNANTILEATMLSAGSYSSVVAPSFNHAMGERLEKAVKNVPGIQSVSAHVDDSTLRFTVKDKAKVKIADLQKAVSTADAQSIITTPELAGAHSVLPGIH